MNSDMQKELAALLQAQRELKHHASLQPLISAVKQAQSSVGARGDMGQPDDTTCIQAAIDIASQALKRSAAAPQAAADCVKKLHSSVSKLGRSIDKNLPHADNVEATIPPLPPASQHSVKQSLLEACALSLATMGHVDAADQLASSLRQARGAADDGAHRAAAGVLPSTFDQYRAAANLRRRLQEGDLEAAAEVQQLLQATGDRLLLLKLHRAVLLHLLLPDPPAHDCSAELQIKVILTSRIWYCFGVLLKRVAGVDLRAQTSAALPRRPLPSSFHSVSGYGHVCLCPLARLLLLPLRPAAAALAAPGALPRAALGGAVWCWSACRVAPARMRTRGQSGAAAAAEVLALPPFKMTTMVFKPVFCLFQVRYNAQSAGAASLGQCLGHSIPAKR